MDEIKSCWEDRDSDIINVNNGLPIPYAYDIPKKWFHTTTHYILSNECHFSRLLLWFMITTV